MLAEADLEESVLAMFSDLLGSPLQTSPARRPAAARVFVSACVYLTGNPAAVVVVSATEEIARALSCQLLEIAPEDLGACDVPETFAELANIIGGNVKGMFESQCHLSVPAVALAQVALPTSPVVTACQFTASEGGNLTVAVHENIGSAGHAETAE